MICENAIPISSPVPENPFNIAMDLSWVFGFSLCVSSAFTRRRDAGEFDRWIPASRDAQRNLRRCYKSKSCTGAPP